MSRFLYDTNVFVYAFGGPHPYREPCRDVVRLAEIGALRGHASVDLVQEVLQQRLRQTGDRFEARLRAANVADLCILHAAQPGDVPRALDLFTRHAGLSPREAFLAAVALNRSIVRVLSADQGFTGIPGLQRIDPLDEAAVAALVT